MILLLLFSFVAGIVTVLSPCILPVLPIILSSSVDTSGKRRPLGVVTGFVFSFTFFTLFLSGIVSATGLSANFMRNLSVVVLILFGFSMYVTGFQALIERWIGRLNSLAPNGQTKHGFWGGVVIGLSLGLLWTPCVGPILASVISLALSGLVTSQTVLITLAYSLGTSLPMFFIMQASSQALTKLPWLFKRSAIIQKTFGGLMIVTALAIFFNVDRMFQSYVVQTFPRYGADLTKLEDTIRVKTELEKITGEPMDTSIFGKPTSDLTQPKGPVAPELILGGSWFNSQPLTLSALKGKVVLVDFWTYSCINCQRTLPYLRKWWETYKDKGLIIIGVHAPEFEFEKNEANVAKALKDFSLTYPVMQDNNFATWKVYSNHYWPAKYLIDKDGLVRYTHFGEGGYDDTEDWIQQLLTEAGETNVDMIVSNPSTATYANTPETYLGYARISNFASPERIVKNKVSTYSLPVTLYADEMAFGGSWEVMDEYAHPMKGSILQIRFDAKEVYLVMRPKQNNGNVTVTVDGKPQHEGEDVKNGSLMIDADRLYKIVKLNDPGEHLLQLEFEDDNVEVFAFTFG